MIDKDVRVYVMHEHMDSATAHESLAVQYS